MNNEYWLIFLITFLITSCGGGGGGSPYPSPPDSPNQTLSNLNSANACKKAWYTTMPTASSSNAVFNNYSFFWQASSFEAIPLCKNYYETTTAIISTGGVSWKDYINELLEYSKNTLGQIVPVNVFVLGADAGSPYNKVLSSDVNTL